MELVEFRQRNIGAQSSMQRELVADTSGDATEHTQPDLSGAQQQRNWSLALRFPLHRRSRPQGSNMEKQEGRRVQFLAVYDVSGVHYLNLFY